MRYKVIYISMLLSAFLFGFAFYFAIIYIPFTYFLLDNEYIITILSTIIGIFVALLNFKTIFRILNKFTYHLIGFRLD